MNTCSVEGCDRPHFCKTFCQMHYARQRRGKPVGPAQPLDRVGYSIERQEYDGDEAACRVCGTSFRRRAIGSAKLYCSTRCRQRAQTAAARARGYVRPATGRTCKHPDGCSQPEAARGWCAMHLGRIRVHGSPGPASPKRTRNGQSAWKHDSSGYLYRIVNGRKVLQHREVMADQLGRPLYSDENVHHLNGVRDDNRPKNLELWSSWQPAGQRVEDKIAWARELLARYDA